jgi:hypothetical protein
MRITDSTIYFTDNGAAYCGAHLGSTAKYTGCDRSGQPIEPVTPELAAECQSVYGYVPKCEECGRAASVLATAGA